MDDLEVIRLALRKTMTKGRIAWEWMDVKGKFGNGRGRGKSRGCLTLSTGFSLVRQSSLTEETSARLKECCSERFQVALRVALSWSEAWQIQERSKESRMPVQEER